MQQTNEVSRGDVMGVFDVCRGHGCRGTGFFIGRLHLGCPREGKEGKRGGITLDDGWRSIAKQRVVAVSGACKQLGLNRQFKV